MNQKAQNIKHTNHLVIAVFVLLLALLTACNQDGVLEAAPDNVLVQPQAGVTVTKVNVEDRVVEGGVTGVRVSFSSADFPPGSVVTDVNLTVRFVKTDFDSPNLSCPYTGTQTFNQEIFYSLRSPRITPASEAFVIPRDTYSGGVYGGEVAVTLDDSAPTLVGGTPTSGTFRPRDPLSRFNGESPIGTWTLFVGERFPDNILCHRHFELSVTAAPSDTTPPVITPNISGTVSSDGWYTSDVALSWTVSDPDSPISASTGCDLVNITADQAATSYTCSATSAGGSSSETVSIKRDATAPTDITFTGSIDDSDSFVWGNVPANDMACSADGTISGLASCVVTGYSDAVGSHTLTAIATDVAGNTSRATRSYTVLAWTLSGFFSPLSSVEDVYNSAKAGSTVPMKFKVHAGSVEQTSTSAVRSFSVTKVACDTGIPENSVDFVTTGGTSLRYDTTAGQFVQNWQTPTTSGCYRATMTTQDGSTLEALFRLR